MKRTDTTPRSATDVALRLALVVAGMFLVAIGLVPHTGLYRTMTVLSGSMRPALPVGSISVVTPEKPADVRVGQVIAFQAPVPDRHVVSHRVIQVIDNGTNPIVRTKGDANSAPDPWNARLDGTRIWRVRTAIPGIGWLIVWLRSPIAHRALVLGAPLLLALAWLTTIWTHEPSTTVAWDAHAHA